jgi:hypothetical protein
MEEFGLQLHFDVIGHAVGDRKSARIARTDAVQILSDIGEGVLLVGHREGSYHSEHQDNDEEDFQVRPSDVVWK